MGWRDIADGEVDSLSPVTVSLMTALRDNPKAIAQRDLGAPRVKPPSIELIDTVGSSTWTVPDGVTRLRYTLVGGGGGGGDADNTLGGVGSDGGDSTLNDGTNTYTAGGGAGGTATVNLTIGGAGGTASGGILNLDGTFGFGNGLVGVTPLVGTSYGAGGRGGQAAGGAGGGSAAVVQGSIEVIPGNSLAYTIADGGAGGGQAGFDGVKGALILEY